MHPEDILLLLEKPFMSRSDPLKLPEAISVKNKVGQRVT
jgi:hypothetical protein